MYEQVNNITRTAVQMQQNLEASVAIFSSAILGEVTHYVRIIVTSIYKKYEAEHQEVNS